MKLESTGWWSRNILAKRLAHIVNNLFNGSVKEHKTKEKWVSWWNWMGGQGVGWISLDILHPKYPQTSITLSLGMRMKFPFRQLKAPCKATRFLHRLQGWRFPEQAVELAGSSAGRTAIGGLAWISSSGEGGRQRAPEDISQTASSFFPARLGGL